VRKYEFMNVHQSIEGLKYQTLSMRYHQQIEGRETSIPGTSEDEFQAQRF
jgi:hypothetical protein